MSIYKKIKFTILSSSCLYSDLFAFTFTFLESYLFTHTQMSSKSKTSVLNPRNIVEPDRPMVTVERIKRVESIQGSDKLVLVFVQGWQAVTSKEYNFKEGDLCIFFTEDSVVDHKAFAPEGYVKVKVISIKQPGTFERIQVLSQGLVGPLNWLSPYMLPSDATEGQNVTSIMSVKKYVSDKEAHLYESISSSSTTVSSSSSKSSTSSVAPTLPTSKLKFPEYMTKTDEPRFQTNADIFLEMIKNKDVSVTLKYDGTSGAFGLYGQEFQVCSRNFRLLYYDGDKTSAIYFNIAKQYDIENKLRTHGYENIAFYGEITGPKINGNRQKVTECSWNVFYIQDLITKTYYSRSRMEKICQELGFPYVQELYRGPYIEKFPTVEDLYTFVKQMQEQFRLPFTPEGICVSSENDDGEHQWGRSVSFKVILDSLK